MINAIKRVNAFWTVFPKNDWSYSLKCFSFNQFQFLCKMIRNHKFLTTETNLKALYIFCCLVTTSSVNLPLEIFVYKCLFTNVCLQLRFSEQGKTTLRKPFTIWKWKHISKMNHILEKKADSETHFENGLHFSFSRRT